AELQYLFKSHKLPIEALVWHQSMTEWASAKSLELFEPQPRVIEVETETFHGSPPPRKEASRPPSWCSPWRRYFARAIDTTLLFPVFSFITGIQPHSLADYRFNMMAIAFAILAHAALQSSWGSTPGKAMLGYKVRTRNGDKLSFKQAIDREARIAWHGLGLGIPLYSVYTQFKAFTNLNNTGETSWDKADDLVVTHR
ncbi:MAG: RDD family protein, partial [Planctomycetota bacterium]|nr:RDD family protein [Planctomycetota bacterium]